MKNLRNLSLFALTLSMDITPITMTFVIINSLVGQMTVG